VSELRTRSATAGDLDAVLALWRLTGPPGATDTPQALQLLLAADSQALLLAEGTGLLLGTLIAAWDGWRASLYRLAVREGHRRRRVATALLHEGERRLRARGATRVTAIVDERDAAAIAFWQAAGYTREPHQARLVRHLEG
jgi:ribosomal protein S18 acetylase RimI-like enzyme